MGKLNALFNINSEYEIIILLLTVVCLTMFLKAIYAFKRCCLNSELNWSDLIKAKGTNNVSLTKVMQLVGITTATGIVIVLTIQQKISWDMFVTYLSYCGGSEAYSKYLSTKHGAASTYEASKLTEKH